ncbi:hypothetical protein F5Y06DRAFT_283507 [Hypoxylon sp. FL0890]|nr:hypothetical protein F5Y06DRAFT_283507 [Hypoxylon sp. FL0890]
MYKVRYIRSPHLGNVPIYIWVVFCNYPAYWYAAMRRCQGKPVAGVRVHYPFRFNPWTLPLGPLPSLPLLFWRSVPYHNNSGSLPPIFACDFSSPCDYAQFPNTCGNHVKTTLQMPIPPPVRIDVEFSQARRDIVTPKIEETTRNRGYKRKSSCFGPKSPGRGDKVERLLRNT